MILWSFKSSISSVSSWFTWSFKVTPRSMSSNRCLAKSLATGCPEWVGNVCRLYQGFVNEQAWVWIDSLNIPENVRIPCKVFCKTFQIAAFVYFSGVRINRIVVFWKAYQVMLALLQFTGKSFSNCGFVVKWMMESSCPRFCVDGCFLKKTKYSKWHPVQVAWFTWQACSRTNAHVYQWRKCSWSAEN